MPLWSQGIGVFDWGEDLAGRQLGHLDGVPACRLLLFHWNVNSFCAEHLMIKIDLPLAF